MKKNWQKSMGMGIMAPPWLCSQAVLPPLNTGAVNTGKTADTMSMEQKQEEPMMNNDNLHTIYLAGGQLRGIEAYMKKLPGVRDTDVEDTPMEIRKIQPMSRFAMTIPAMRRQSGVLTALISTEQLLDGFFQSR